MLVEVDEAAGADEIPTMGRWPFELMSRVRVASFTPV
jgi:hypothetical protein